MNRFSMKGAIRKIKNKRFFLYAILNGNKYDTQYLPNKTSKSRNINNINMLYISRRYQL